MLLLMLVSLFIADSGHCLEFISLDLFFAVLVTKLNAST